MPENLLGGDAPLPESVQVGIQIPQVMPTAPSDRLTRQCGAINEPTIFSSGWDSRGFARGWPLNRRCSGQCAVFQLFRIVCR